MGKNIRFPLHSGLIYIFFLSVLFSQTGCSKYLPKLRVMEANFLYSQGRFAQAITVFMDALNDKDAAPYAEYGLGTVYMGLNENEAALGRFETAAGNLAERDYDRELMYRIEYNRGIIFFGAGDYSNAALKFRKALELDSGRIEAKRNLELSLLSHIRQSSGSETSLPMQIRQGEEGHKSLFDYMRAKEEDQWRSREWQDDPESGELDY